MKVHTRCMMETAAQPLSSDRMEKGARIYAIGDIHGCHDLLAPLLEEIERELREEPPTGPARIIFLGDYIDRGSQSRQVIERLLNFHPDTTEVIFLKGNHEAVFLTFLQDASVGPGWADFGGIEMLTSYGAGRGGVKPGMTGWEHLRQDLIHLMPESHKLFFQNLRSHAYFAPYLFVHAGINPAKPLAAQTEHDFLWIRDPFLKDQRTLPFQVVHGHTPVHKPYVDHRRISIDTCAYKSGKLTALRLDEQKISFLHTVKSSATK